MGRVSTDYRVGTASWTDPTLLASGFYPSRCRSAEARLRFYAQSFRTVEVDSTYYALPSERNAQLWAERAPEDFRFNIKAFAWLTGHEAETRSLPQAIRARLDPNLLHDKRLRAPNGAALELAFDMFRSALQPLRAADKLGCVLFQYPPWFTATEANRCVILRCRDAMPGDRLAVEFRHASWTRDGGGPTLAFLERHGLVFVCADAPSAPSIPPPLFRATSETAYVRFHGRNRDAWFRSHTTAAERFKYLYTDAELQQCAARIRGLGSARTYVLFNNCYSDYGVRNALTMQQLLAAPDSA